MPFDKLGLGEDATERDVRRAYAVRLKKTRPDDDPVAFQALHEAYQACLEEVRYREEESLEADESDEHGEETAVPFATPRALPGPRFGATVLPALASNDEPPVADADAHEPAPATDEGDAYAQDDGFNLTTFLQALFTECDTATPAGLEAWLNRQPDLYSISLKSIVTVPVLQAVVDREPALRPPLLDVVAAFFGAGQLGRQHWWLAEELEQAKARAVAADQFSAGRLPRANPQENIRAFDLVIDRRIASRHWHGTNLLLMLIPGVPSRFNARMEEIDHLTQGASLELVNPRLRHIAATLADRTRVGWPRLALTWARAACIGLALVIVASVLNDGFRPRALLGVALVALAFTAWQLVMAGYLAARRTMTRKGQGHRWPETLSAALLALALGLGLAAVTPLWLAIVLAVLGSRIAATEHRYPAWVAVTIGAGVAVTFFTALDLYTLPLPPAVAALAFPGVLTLLVDRLQSRLTGRELDDVATDQHWLVIAGAVCAAAVVLALVLVAAL